MSHLELPRFPVNPRVLGRRHVGNRRCKPVSSSILKMPVARRRRLTGRESLRQKPPRKPMAMVRRVSLFEREVTVRLAPAAGGRRRGAARGRRGGERTGGSGAGAAGL